MRFIPDGPSLPDELLTARDAGDVLFFCGAGVSRAEAHLPDFATLAEKVLAGFAACRVSGWAACSCSFFRLVVVARAAQIDVFVGQ